MANITRDYFLSLYDEFSDVPSTKLDAWIGVASNRVSLDAWNGCGEIATAMLAAHLLSSSGGKGGGSSKGTSGPITSESVGDLSRSYGTVQVNSDADKPLTTTRYGLEYLALRAECVVGATITNGDIESSIG